MLQNIYQSREHKYRAKMVGLAPTVRKEYQWAEGAYYKHINRMPCPIGDEVKPEDIDHVIIRSGFADWNMPRQLEVVRVDPNTVCEYIGENDVKNQPIYEYCWVAFPDVGEDGYETKEGFDFTNVALVVQRNGRWELTNFFSDNSSVLEDMQDQPHNQFKDIFKCCEVVGNMFDDTPEEIRQKVYGNVTIPDPEAMSEDELFDACAQSSNKE